MASASEPNIQKLKPVLGWEALRRYRRWLGSRSGFLDRRFRFPNPLKVPYRRSQLHLGRSDGHGDVLLCTPALRELKRINPACDVTFYTYIPGLLRGLPFIDAVRGFDERPGDCIILGYENLIPPHRHIAEIIGDNLGLRVRDVRPSCAVNPELVSRFLAEWRDMRRPRIIVNRRAGATPNKDWPDEYWGDLLDRLTGRFSVIEIGASAQDRGVQPDDHYLDLRGKTSLEELVAAIGAADVHVGPISGPVHIAAALGTPAIVILGGYEHPVCTAYPGNINLYSPVRCAPCWLPTPCPYGKDCLSRIKPAPVEEAVSRLWCSTSDMPKRTILLASQDR